MRFFNVILSFFLIIMSSVNLFSQKNVIINTENAPKAIGPYSQAIKSGDMLFLSGQIALDKNGKMQNESIESETTQVFENIKEIMKAAGYELSDAVKCTVFMTELNDFQKMNDIYAKYFPENPPARSTIEVRKLPKNARIEIEVIARKIGG